MGRYLFPYIRNKSRKDIEPNCLNGRGRKAMVWNTQQQRLMCFCCVIVSAGFRNCCYSTNVKPLPEDNHTVFVLPEYKVGLNIPGKYLLAQTLHFLST